MVCAPFQFPGVFWFLPLSVEFSSYFNLLRRALCRIGQRGSPARCRIRPHHSPAGRERKGRGIACAYGLPAPGHHRVCHPMRLVLASLTYLPSRRCSHLKCSHQKPLLTAYVCPRCGSRCCELPNECAVCGAMLILSSHLARSFHHLFPLPDFAPVVAAEYVCCVKCVFPAFVQHQDGVGC